MPIFIDTNIILYAAGGAHPQKEACARVLQRVADGSIDATIHSEVLQEILYVLSRRNRREEAAALVEQLSQLFPDMLPVTREDMIAAAGLIRRYPGLSVRDAVHAATMQRAGISEVISVDIDFDLIAGLRRLDPSQFGN
jgi:uncharacterized protein